MTESNEKPSSEVTLILRGLKSQIEKASREGKKDRSALDIAKKIKDDALESFEGNLDKHADFLKACDIVIKFIDENPDKKITKLLD